VNELPAAAAAIDPTTATTLTEYGVLVGRLIAACQLSRNDVVRRSEGMSSSTLHNLINGKAVARPGTVPRVLEACNLPAAIKSRWENKWLDLTTEKSKVGSRCVQEQLDKTAHELTEATRQIAALREEEASLRAKLTAEQQQTSILTGERNQHEHYIAELTSQLKYAQEEIIRTENLVRLLAEERDALEAANEALQAQLDIITYERGRRHDAEVRAAHAVEQRDEVGRALSRMQSEHAGTAQEVRKPPTALRNTPIEATIAVRDRDFGQPHQLSIRYVWYCIPCDKGGSNSSYGLCPHCHRGIIEHYNKTVQLEELPKKPCYGETLTVHERGNHDYPELDSGDLLIHVTKKFSSWTR